MSRLTVQMVRGGPGWVFVARAGPSRGCVCALNYTSAKLSTGAAPGHGTIALGTESESGLPGDVTGVPVRLSECTN